jgi:poly-gamma-glutamate capsule biosynthesis protein CapA/YwtB (metallophosphatase superfamily)/outer membrane protein assembly factor BamB
MPGPALHHSRRPNRREVAASAALVVLIAWSLTSCGPRPPTSEALAPSATPGVALPTAASPSPLATATQSPTPTPTSRPAPTRAPLPTSSVAPLPILPPSPTATPAPPPLLTPAAGQPLPLSLGWQFSADGHLTGGAVVQQSGRTIFLLTSLGRSVYALDDGGHVLWQVRTAAPVYTLAVLDGQRIAVGDDAGIVTLLGMGGRTIWQRDLGSRVTALFGWQGGLLAGGWDERLTFLSPEGQVEWQAALEGPVSGIAGLPDLAVVATLEGEVRAFDAHGAQVWCFEASVALSGLGVVGESPEATFLCGEQDGRLLALDASGALRWQRTLDATAEGSPVWHAAALLEDGPSQLIAGTGGARPVLVLLSAGGQFLWRAALPSPVQAITSLDLDGDGAQELLVGLANGQIQVYDAEGRLRAAVHAGLAVWGLEAGSALLVRADVVAWQLAATDGPRGGSWLPPPALQPSPPASLPPGIRQVDGPGEATLAFLGDVSPGRSMEAQLVRYGPSYPWAGLEPLLRDADLAVANLEGVLTTQGEPLNKQYLIRAHPRWGQTLVEAGFDLVTVANNHALDYGPAGLDETLDTLNALGIASVGAGRSEGEARRPALFDLNGVRVAVLGYAAARWNGSADVPPTDRIAWADLAQVQADVRAVRAQADFVVVLLHAGTEYAAEPSRDQVAVAHAAIDAGADLVVGHHPHVTQTVERYGQGLIAYSLGDALFDIPRRAAMQGDLLRVHVTRQGLAQAELWPFWIDDAIRPRFLDDGHGDARVEVIYP